MTLDISIATRPIRGETANGDQVLAIMGDSAVIAVVDGLGHGPRAEEASTQFCDFVRENPTLDLESMMRGASEHISKTRGAAAALVRMNPGAGTLAFIGVGNIEMQAVSGNPIRPVCTPGIVGRPLRKVIEFRYAICQDDLFAIYSDGVSSRFDLRDYRQLTARQCAETILQTHGKYHDDATVVVVRYVPK